MNEKRFRRISNVAIIAVLATTLFIAVFASTDESATPTGAIYAGNENGGAVALTFNVYENTENTLKIANLLAERGFSATFFVGGKWVERNGDALVKLYSEGMEIGNHGYLHRDHATLSVSQNRDEILLTEKLIDSYLSAFDGYENCRLFAPPSGSMGKNMFQVTDALGYKVVMWTRDTIDWRDHDENLIYERAVKNAKSGDIILMHPTTETLSALPRILDTLESLSLSAKKVSAVI